MQSQSSGSAPVTAARSPVLSRRAALLGGLVASTAAAIHPSPGLALSAFPPSLSVAEVEAVVSEARISSALECEAETDEALELAAARAEAADQRLAELSERLWSAPAITADDLRARALIAEHWLGMTGADGPSHFDRSIAELVRAVLAATQAPSA